MKGRKLFLLITVLFICTLNILAPVLSDAKHEEIKINYKLRTAREYKEKEFTRFLDSVAYSESRGNPKAYNKYGYIGKYQFGNIARKSCGYGYISCSDFIKNPSIWSEKEQDTAMLRLLQKNEQHLAQIIHVYDGLSVKGTIVTKSGMLAAAHLAGASGVKDYFMHDLNPNDVYGTSLEDYLFRFSGFNF